MHPSISRAHIVMSAVYAGVLSVSALFIAACADASNATGPQRTTSYHGPSRESFCDSSVAYCDCGAASLFYDCPGSGWDFSPAPSMSAAMLQSVDNAVNARTLNTPECQQLVNYWYSVPAQNIKYDPNEPGWAYTDPAPDNSGDPNKTIIGFTQLSVQGPWSMASSAIHESAHAYYGDLVGDGPTYVNGQWNPNSAYGWQAHCVPGP